MEILNSMKKEDLFIWFFLFSLPNMGNPYPSALTAVFRTTLSLLVLCNRLFFFLVSLWKSISMSCGLFFQNRSFERPLRKRWFFEKPHFLPFLLNVCVYQKCWILEPIALIGSVELNLNKKNFIPKEWLSEEQTCPMSRLAN
jgi:hypothetical protein